MPRELLVGAGDAQGLLCISTSPSGGPDLLLSASSPEPCQVPGRMVLSPWAGTEQVPGVCPSRLKPQKRPGGGAAQPCENIVVAYYFCGEPIPYRTLVKGRVVTLGQFKELLTKKGNYR